MAINKLQGLRPKVSTIDEWLSGDIREDVVGAIEQGASKMDDYLIVAISSEVPSGMVPAIQSKWNSNPYLKVSIRLPTSLYGIINLMMWKKLQILLPGLRQILILD